MTNISFGDKVRVIKATETDALNISNLTGEVYGETTPSVTGIEPIGESDEDIAFNVHFDELDQSFWISPNLLDFLDHNAGTEITLDGIDKKWTRNDNGHWIEENTRPWWKFWKKST